MEPEWEVWPHAKIEIELRQNLNLFVVQKVAENAAHEGHLSRQLASNPILRVGSVSDLSRQIEIKL